MRHLLCKVGDVPEGAAKVVQIEKHILAAFHRPDGFFVIDERCSHRGGPLSEGDIVGNEVVCPWHGARFNLKDGKTTSRHACLKSYPTTVENDEVWVEIPSP